MSHPRERPPAPHLQLGDGYKSSEAAPDPKIIPNIYQ